MINDDEIRRMRNVFKEILRIIKENNRFIIYRHNSPDFDALGSQYGLATWIKDNFPNKEVYCVGDVDPNLIPILFPKPDELTEGDYHKEHIAITVDVADSLRVSNNHLSQAKLVVKIDHHNKPEIEKDFGNVQAVFPTRPAAAEILALFALSRSRRYRLSLAAASYFYIGIVGDTGRFLYQDTDGATLRLAGALLDCGVDKTEIYNRMYATDERKINILKYCLNNYKVTDAGTAYYVIDKDDLKNLNMTTMEGNLHINILRDLKEAKVIASITFDPDKNDYRVSIRSSSIVIEKIARIFNGGGHDYAAGCRLTSLDELPKLLNALDKIILENKA